MIVFDSGALIALLRLEPGALVVRQILRSHPGECCIHAINLCEIYYGFERAINTAYAERAIALIQSAGVEVRDEMDSEFWKEAAHLKAAYRLSLADAFAVSMTKRLDAILLTTDHHELDVIATNKICQITFIR